VVKGGDRLRVETLVDGMDILSLVAAGLEEIRFLKDEGNSLVDEMFVSMKNLCLINF
jgi:hypothetical protein